MKINYFKLTNYLASLLLCLFSSSVWALQDPATRNEDISATQVTVNVTKEGQLYKYEYTVNNPSTNLGILNALMLDLSCDIDFGDVEIPVPAERAGYFGDKSSDGKHIPVEVFAAYGTSNTYGVTKSNQVLWGMFVTPGKSVSPIWILSPAPPGPITYTVQPFLNSNPDVWDYSNYEEGDPNVPWIEDFTVTGTITGPTCNIDDPDTELFKGTGTEPFNINTLLQYAQPLEDPLYVTTSNEVIQFNIVYSESIQKDSFKAILNGQDISSLFKPVPNTSEVVTVSGPWKKLNKLKISVLGVVDGRVKGVSQNARPDKSFSTPAQTNSAREFDEFKSKDVDTFHIWMKP